VGKSTLVNRLVGQKVSITSRKAQTTRHVIRGILTTPEHQFVFVDTPGFQTHHKSALNRLMNRSVTQSLNDVDVILCVVEASRFGDDDRAVLRLLPGSDPVLLVINKVDQLADKRMLLPYIERVSREFTFAEIVPLSASRGTGTAALLRAAGAYLPESEALFSADEVTDRSERFLAAERVREKLFRRLGDELPYGIAVEVEKFEETEHLRRIHAEIIVDKPAHKAMVIGRQGESLKAVATEARLDMEKLFGTKVYLELWVKVRSGWGDDERALKSLGYE
jgi:GTP-binding protein Era